MIGAEVPVRLSRRAMQQRTRERLLAAAFETIAAEGTEAASVRGICERAGLSQGAFYSNFATKDDLLLDLMEQHLQDEIELLRAAIAATEGESLERTLALIAGRLAELSTTTAWSLLAIELQLHAVRNRAFAERYDHCKGAYHTEFALALQSIIERHRLTPALPPLQIAIGLHALWSGFIVQATLPGALPRDQMLLGFFRAVTGCGAGSALEDGEGAK